MSGGRTLVRERGIRAGERERDKVNSTVKEGRFQGGEGVQAKKPP